MFEAFDMKYKQRVQVLNPVIIGYLTRSGHKRYRVQGISKYGTKVSTLISTQEAMRYKH